MNKELVWKSSERKSCLENKYKNMLCLKCLISICLIKNLAKKGFDHVLVPRILSKCSEQLLFQTSPGSFIQYFRNRTLHVFQRIFVFKISKNFTRKLPQWTTIYYKLAG